ncbi:MAG TPA: hypothetical protein VK169_05585 [Saprospiraceae bacterium]|nr:hypothetical protein [Saprospiraceae bacterium]
MKRIIFLALVTILISFSSSFSQINVGSKEYVTLKPGKIEQSDLDALKASKTYFVYRPSDDVEELKKAISEVWKFTEITFIPYDDIDNIPAQNASIFALTGYNKQVYSTVKTNNTKVYLSLWMEIKNKKGKTKKITFCRIEFHPIFKDLEHITSLNTENEIGYLYNQGTLNNWNTGFLKNYLKNVNDRLQDGTNRWLYKSESNHAELKNLAKETLYIPDYLLVKFNKFDGDESEKLDKVELFEKYPFKYEILSAKELSEKIISEEKPFYYLVYVKSSTDVYFTIFNSKTGEIIYSSYKSMSYNASSSDFKSITSGIKSQLEK